MPILMTIILLMYSLSNPCENHFVPQVTGVVSSSQRRGAIKEAASTENLFLPPKKNAFTNIHALFYLLRTAQ